MRAYDATTGRQVNRTYRAPRAEWGAGIRTAKKELARLVTEVSEGQHGGTNATLAYLLEEWLRHGEARGRSPSTMHGYRAKVARVKKDKIAGKRVSKLTTRDLDTFYAGLLDAGMTPATLVHHHRVIRAALNQAEKWGWVNRNVARTATLGNAERPEMNVPTVEQARALVLRGAKTTSPDLGPILLFAMLTGMRRGELCGLKWADVDWSGRRITVRRSIWQVRSTWGTKDPKTHQVRTLALDDAAVALLMARQFRAEAEAEDAGVALPTEGYIWSTAVDGHCPRTPNSLTRAFHRLCRTMETEAKAADPPRTEVWPFRFHDLRHLSSDGDGWAGDGPSHRCQPARSRRPVDHPPDVRPRPRGPGPGRRRRAGAGAGVAGGGLAIPSI